MSAITVILALVPHAHMIKTAVFIIDLSVKTDKIIYLETSIY